MVSRRGKQAETKPVVIKILGDFFFFRFDFLGILFMQEIIMQILGLKFMSQNIINGLRAAQFKKGRGLRIVVV